MNKPLSVPAFETLPSSEDVVQISQWLKEAGLSSLELSNEQGTRLRISVGNCEAPSANSLPLVPSALPALPREEPAQDIKIKARYFGNLLRRNPVTKEEFAAEGGSVCAEETVAMLQIGELTVPITAPQAGTVVQFMANEGDLIGYGQTILTLRPSP